MANILIIEDQEIVRDLLREVLESEGHEVTEVADGVEGLARFRERRHDLIITDIFMPEKEGLQTIMEIRQEAPDVKIIAISGGQGPAGFDPLPIARMLGAVRTLLKPIDSDELLACVRQVLET